MIIPIDKGKIFYKIQHPFMIKNSHQTRNRGELPQSDKERLQKPTRNIIPNGEKPAFPLRSVTR